MSGHWISIAAVWVLAVIGATLTGLTAPPGETLAWVALTLAGCTLVTLSLQLATGQKEGYVARVTASIVGAVIVLSVATLVFGMMHLS
ncbi:hypothetical protein [Cryobacterium psychrophilum]|uniref:Uncharacterized protein n=1 Tax=Cryobacterium psychrophilum TaxID=41988 RepID=A0A4Y8KVN7_9MICO|nr:hypothetical protein [Cryobacterium psychrophilum]TDW29544.1 hypothetical protein EDD25_1252 [Cryobacterium psychrophilum]TFD81680.1 hypothetical protein E3T53_01345 [Cryobacterium psychrophilum]